MCYKTAKTLNRWLNLHTGIDFTRWGILGIGVGAIIFFPELNFKEKISAAVLWTTAVIILQYTVETHKLRRINEALLDSSIENKKLTFLPIIAISGFASGYDSFVLTIENIGRGLAQNIKVWFPSHVNPCSVENISERVIPNSRTLNLDVQPSSILSLPEEKRRIKIEYLDIFGRKIITWALVVAETTEEGHPRKDHLAMASWWLELPE